MLNRLAGKGVSVIGIALDREGAAVVRPFVEELGLSYPMLIGSQEVFEQFEGYGVPYSLLLDPQFRVHRIYRSPVSEETLLADVSSAGRS